VKGARGFYCVVAFCTCDDCWSKSPVSLSSVLFATPSKVSANEASYRAGLACPAETAHINDDAASAVGLWGLLNDTNNIALILAYVSCSFSFLDGASFLKQMPIKSILELNNCAAHVKHCLHKECTNLVLAIEAWIAKRWATTILSKPICLLLTSVAKSLIEDQDHGLISSHQPNVSQMDW